MTEAAQKRKVAFLGSSTIAGKGQAFDLLGELRKRQQNQSLELLNFGVGGDLSYNALKRLPGVVAAQPDKVIIIIGSNDILTSVFENVWRIFSLTKHLPQRPTPKWFEENITAIVCELKEKTTASIAVASLPQVGEDIHSQDPAQAKLNMLYREYATIIQRVAAEQGIAYIPLYERLYEQIEVSPGPAFVSFRFLPFYWDTFRYFMLCKTSDEIARANGWQFHVDGVHLNKRGGIIVTDTLQRFL